MRRGTHQVEDTNSGFLEAALIIDPDTAQQRFTARATAAGDNEAWGQLSTDLLTIADNLDRFLQTRPAAYRINEGPGSIDELDEAVAHCRRRHRSIRSGTN